jgi:hypothetical protein
MMSLAEKLFILAIDDDQGAISASKKSKLRYGLDGAILVELAITGKIVTEEGSIHAADPTPTGDSLCDHWLALIIA